MKSKILTLIISGLLLVGSNAWGRQPAQQPSLSTATFAAGCFWCVQEAFDKAPGVVKVIVGFTGGHLANPTYRQVSRENTGHYEAVEVKFDPRKISYQQLLQVFWRNSDPTDAGGQFCDRGPSYRTAIFYHNERQKRLATQSKAQLVASNKLEKVVTPILPAGKFYPADESHQDYYKKNPFRYKFYKSRCGRVERLNKVWGDEKN
ncbi:MAG: hypothetical protein Tsb005_03360 [Gammaproteobacteria bacterium]